MSGFSFRSRSRRDLLTQWIERLKTFLDIDPKAIGVIGGGRRKPTGVIDIALIQSLVRQGEVSDLVADYGHLVVDECHHLSAASFELVARRAKARYVLGLSATVARKDGHHPIIFMQCGPVRHRVDARAQAAERGIVHRVKHRSTEFQLPRNHAAAAALARRTIVERVLLRPLIGAVLGALYDPRGFDHRTERRRTFTDQEKRAILAEAFAAGGSPTDFASRLEISTGLLYTWRKKALASAGEAGVCEPAFLPAVVADMAPQAPPAAHDLEPRRCAAIEIDFGAGVKVRIEAGVPKEVIAATLKALR